MTPHRRGCHITTALAVLVAIAGAMVRPAMAAEPPRAKTAARHIAILCYHDVSDDAQAPLQTVPADFLRRQIRDVRRAGWTIVPLGELLAHRRHPEALPAKTLVLTFDDGYRSFRDQALPVLREAHVPATLAVISGFVGQPPAGMPPLLGWDELRALSQEPLLEIASHSHALHRYETSDPYRDTAPSVATRRYLLAEARYENREEYRSRIRADLDSTRHVIARNLGAAPAVLVWPYGMHNEMARGLAEQAGFTGTLALGGREVNADDLRSGCLPRIMVTRKFRFDQSDAAWLEPPVAPMHAADVDLDDVYSPDPEVFRNRLDQLVKRIRGLGATHVFMSVCSDTAAGGRFTSTWCMNHQVRCRADVWSMVAAKLAQARIKVWARVPSLELTWSWEQHPEWRVEPGSNDAIAARWPTRVSPDLPEAKRAAIDFVTDLAVYAPIDGVVFDDDAAMAANERFASGRAATAREKADAIDDLLTRCRDAVRAWRPECRFGRIVDGRVVEAAGVQPDVAQDFTRTTHAFDVTIVDTHAATRTIERLARRALARTRTANVMFAIQALDRSDGRWLPGRAIGEMTAAAMRAGVRNVAISPVAPNAGDLPEGLFEPRKASDLATGEEQYR